MTACETARWTVQPRIRHPPVLTTNHLVPRTPYSAVQLTMAQNQQKTQSQPPQIDWKKIMQVAGPYPMEAFNFVREGLSFTAEQLFGDPNNVAEIDRHLSGQQLCLGL